MLLLLFQRLVIAFVARQYISLEKTSQFRQQCARRSFESHLLPLWGILLLTEGLGGDFLPVDSGEHGQRQEDSKARRCLDETSLRNIGIIQGLIWTEFQELRLIIMGKTHVKQTHKTNL